MESSVVFLLYVGRLETKEGHYYRKERGGWLLDGSLEIKAMGTDCRSLWYGICSRVVQLMEMFFNKQKNKWYSSVGLTLFHTLIPL